MIIRKDRFPSINNLFLSLFISSSLIIVGIYCSLSSAQTIGCDTQLMPISDNTGYILRGDRCEGLYVSPIAGYGGLELISLTKGRLHYELIPGQHLSLKVSSGGMEPSIIQVRAVATALNTYYRMDTLLSNGQTWKWPIDEVLLPLQLTANRVGIFAWSMTASGKVFVPVQVNDSTSNDINLIIRTNVYTQNIMWRISYLLSKQLRTTEWQSVAPQIQAGESINISLPKVSRGFLDVEIAALDETNCWIKLRIKVWYE